MANVRYFSDYWPIFEIAGVAISPDGAWALSGSWDGTVRLWDTVTGKEIRSFPASR